MIYRIVILGLVLLTGLARAETQNEKAGRIIAHVSENFIQKDTSALSEDVERRVRAIVKKLEADPMVFAFEQNAQRDRDVEHNRIFGEIKSNVIKGVLVCLALLIVAVAVRKIGVIAAAAARADKHSDLILVNDTLRTAPYIVTLSVASEADATRVGRSLVDARLAARVDVLPQRALDAEENGSLLLVQTVKGRLKAMKQVLEAHALDQSALSIPVLKGHEAYLNWIADAADGKR